MSVVTNIANGVYKGPFLEIANGLNEFDITYHNSKYQLWRYRNTDNKIFVREAVSLFALDGATETEIISANAVYPTALLDSGTWHLWFKNSSNGNIDHYTSASLTSGWSLQGSINTLGTDPHVRYDTLTSKWIMSHKSGSDGQPNVDGFSTAYVSVATATSLNGPWTDQGPVFNHDQRKRWHLVEEADPATFNADGKLWMLFPAFDGNRQLPSIIELNSSYKAIGEPFVLSSASEMSEFVGNNKLMNPVFVAGDKNYIVYSRNIAFGGLSQTVAGLYLIEERQYTNTTGLPVNAKLLFKDGYDSASGLIPYGDAQYTPNGVFGFAYGYTSARYTGDFTLMAEIEMPYNDPTGDTCIAKVGDKDDTSSFGFYVGTSYALKVANGSTPVSVNYKLQPLKKYFLVIRRCLGFLEVFVNGQLVTKLNSTTVTDMNTYRIGNTGGFGVASGTQFYGYVRRLELWDEVKRLHDLR